MIKKRDISGVTKIKSTTKIISSPRDGHVINHFSNLFSTSHFLQNDGLMEEFIRNLIFYTTNKMLTMLHSREEIYKALFAMNKHNSLDPDSFWGKNFQSLCGIVMEDVVKAVMQDTYQILIRHPFCSI